MTLQGVNYVILWILFNVQSVDDPDELHPVIGENFDLISECGFTEPTTKLTMDDKVTLVQSVALHQCILRMLGEFSELHNGLDRHRAASKHYGQEYFVNKKPGVTAGVLFLLCVKKLIVIMDCSYQ